MCSLLHRELTYGSASGWPVLWFTVFPVYVGSKTEIPDTNEGIPTMGMMVTFRRLGWRCSFEDTLGPVHNRSAVGPTKGSKERDAERQQRR